MIPVLFARKDSIYKQLGCDVWDIDRDAHKWPGGRPGIYHPPCRAWGQLAHMAKPRPDEKALAIWSIWQIRKNGGVLEHPRASRLWPYLNLPVGNETDQYGGYTLCVDQSWWGHKATKNTLLYIVGCNRVDLPQIPLCFNAIEFTISSKIKKKSGRRTKSELPKSEREKTPVDFAKWLICVAEKCVPPVRVEKIAESLT